MHDVTSFVRTAIPGKLRNQSGGLIQILAEVYICAIAALYSLEGLWSSMLVFYAVSGIAALGVMLSCLALGRLYRKTDVLLMLFFLCFAWISATVSFGFTRYFFFSKFFCAWCLLLSLYFVIQCAPDPDRLLRRFGSVFVVGLSASCLYILIHATASIFREYPAQNTVRGCFQLGRLCGFTNANRLGMACAALIMLSIFGWLATAGRKRHFYALPALIGWFVLGMTNCRTGIVGISICVGMLAFLVILRKPIPCKGIWRWIVSGVFAAVLALVIMESLYLPTRLYQIVLRRFANIVGNSDLLNNLQALRVRGVSEPVGTVSDRFLTWKKCLSDVFKTPRRTWFGVSSMDKEGILSVYEGHHEIDTKHALNTYLELLREFGLIGTAIWLILLLHWFRTGIRILRDPQQSVPSLCLSASAAAILAMGLSESVPFTHIQFCYVPILFFLICGFMERKRAAYEE